jgi:hypothetical protein
LARTSNGANSAAALIVFDQGEESETGEPKVRQRTGRNHSCDGFITGMLLVVINEPTKSPQSLQSI